MRSFSMFRFQGRGDSEFFGLWGFWFKFKSSRFRIFCAFRHVQGLRVSGSQVGVSGHLIGVPMNKGILLFGDQHWGSLIVVNRFRA